MDGSAAHTLREGILTGVFLPNLHGREVLGAAYVARTPADEPIVNAATFVQLNAANRVDSAFAAISGASVAPVVTLYLDTLAGNPLDEANIASAVKSVAARVDPVSDFLGSADYRREMAMELARFLTNTENTKLLESLLYITARKSSNAELTFENVADYTDDVPTEVQVYQNAIDHGVPYFGPSDLDISAGMEYFTAAMEAALSRSKTPQQALDDFVREANRAVFGN